MDYLIKCFKVVSAIGAFHLVCNNNKIIFLVITTVEIAKGNLGKILMHCLQFSNIETINEDNTCLTGTNFYILEICGTVNFNHCMV